MLFFQICFLNNAYYHNWLFNDANVNKSLHKIVVKLYSLTLNKGNDLNKIITVLNIVKLNNLLYYCTNAWVYTLHRLYACWDTVSRFYMTIVI